MIARPIRYLALAAMVPALINPAVVGAATGGKSISVGLCGRGGAERNISIPLERPQMPGENQQACCAKGCHTGQHRKKAQRTAN